MEGRSGPIQNNSLLKILQLVVSTICQVEFAVISIDVANVGHMERKYDPRRPLPEDEEGNHEDKRYRSNVFLEYGHMQS